MLLETTNWTSAEAEAISLGGHLVTINNAAENQFILEKFANYAGRVWLGLNDVNIEDTFVWSSGEALTYTNWEPGEPNNSSDEDFVAMYSGNGRWIDVKDLSNPPGIGDIYGVVEVPDLIPDSDGDGVNDKIDNCPCQINPNQTDSNQDGIGDACNAHYFWGDYDQDCDVDADDLNSFAQQYGLTGSP